MDSKDISFPLSSYRANHSCRNISSISLARAAWIFFKSLELSKFDILFQIGSNNTSKCYTLRGKLVLTSNKDKVYCVVDCESLRSLHSTRFRTKITAVRLINRKSRNHKKGYKVKEDDYFKLTAQYNTEVFKLWYLGIAPNLEGRKARGVSCTCIYN